MGFTFRVASAFDGRYDNTLFFGAETATNETSAFILLPLEVHAIDDKIDDGMPAQGFVVVRSRLNCTLKSDGSAITSSAADAAALNAIYNLAGSSSVCSIVFRQLF